MGRPYIWWPVEVIRLLVPYESQYDNRGNTGWRECFSSSCAMLARFWGAVPSDDAYNACRRRFGDTTNPTAQIEALRSLGLRADFWTNGSQRELERHIRAGRPVAVGWLHQGPVASPKGGHWSAIVGLRPQGFLMHDPAGEPLLATGGHIPRSSGRYVACSWPNFLRRWEVEGEGTGWMVTCSR